MWLISFLSSVLLWSAVFFSRDTVLISLCQSRIIECAVFLIRSFLEEGERLSCQFVLCLANARKLYFGIGFLRLLYDPVFDSRYNAF